MSQSSTLEAPSTSQSFIIGGETIIHQETSSILWVKNPVDETTMVGCCALLTPKHVPLLLEKAEKSAQEFATTTATQRAEILNRLAELLEEHTEPLARLITQESGKPIKLATVEVQRAITVCKGYARELDWGKSQNYFIEGRQATVKYFPLGAVLAITPYNFPLNLVVHKLAPAIAAGNSITIKPASKTPLTALYLGRLAVEAGYKAISVIPCKASLAEELVKSDVFKKLSFTGSSDIGWYLKSVSGKKVVTLELGGNAGCVIESIPEDADALQKLAERCAQGSFWLSGQSCISVQRIFVHQALYPKFIEAFQKATEKLVIGDPLSPQTDIGVMISTDETQRSLSWIEEAQAQGAQVLTGGKLNSGSINGILPTILVGTTPEMKVNQCECFAPIVTVTPYPDFETALNWVNQSTFGLQAGVYTTSQNQAQKAYETLEVGGVIINDVPTFRADYLPYGGIKDSGLGREGVLTGIAEMSYIKTLIQKV
jgi:acyl-CoA reductase-like NAD-dependent aldehyde dehydrogenase